jgi:DNA-binding Lrp family transcriptional regulator
MVDPMDDLDFRLIGLLRGNSREPVAKLALALGVSRATIRARIDRLVASGAIQGFTILVKSAGAPNLIRAIVMIEIEGQGADRIIRRLVGFPAVRHLYTTNGRFDVVAELESENLEAFDESLRQIRQVDGISSTETSILLSARKGGF